MLFKLIRSGMLKPSTTPDRELHAEFRPGCQLASHNWPYMGLVNAHQTINDAFAEF